MIVVLVLLSLLSVLLPRNQPKSRAPAGVAENIAKRQITEGRQSLRCDIPFIAMVVLALYKRWKDLELYY